MTRWRRLPVCVGRHQGNISRACLWTFVGALTVAACAGDSRDGDPNPRSTVQLQCTRFEAPPGSDQAAIRATIPMGEYASGAAVYRGPVTLEWEIDAAGPYYESPDATHGRDAACQAASMGQAWGVRAASMGTNAQGSTVRCQYTGEHTRSGAAMKLSLDGSCDITENGSDGSDRVTGDPTHEERTSTLANCTGAAVLRNCDITDVRYDATDGRRP